MLIFSFIRLMGRSASHIALECCLQTQINLAIIGEEVEAKKQTLQEIVLLIADMITERAKNDRDYGKLLYFSYLFTYPFIN